MASLSGELHHGWDRVMGWGRSVTVRSSRDLPMVRRFMDDPGDFRRSVRLHNVTSTERRELTVAIEELGAELREFTDSEKEQLEVHDSRLGAQIVAWGAKLLRLPLRTVLLVQGRESVMYVLTPPSGASNSHVRTVD